jgi:stomatal closure-related actin-binding protein
LIYIYIKDVFYLHDLFVVIASQLAMSKRAEESRLCVYQLEGAQTLGSCIRIRPRANNAPDLSKCSIQWYRLSCESDHKETIAGDYL